jgi:hypothetical protein
VCLCVFVSTGLLHCGIKTVYPRHHPVHLRGLIGKLARFDNKFFPRPDSDCPETRRYPQTTCRRHAPRIGLLRQAAPESCATGRHSQDVRIGSGPSANRLRQAGRAGEQLTMVEPGDLPRREWFRLGAAVLKWSTGRGTWWPAGPSSATPLLAAPPIFNFSHNSR